MKATVDYDSEETQIILVAYQNTFMPPPKGHSWSAIETYCGGAQLVLMASPAEDKKENGNIEEVLAEIIDYIQACRGAGENDLRPILSFVESLIIEYGNKEKAKEGEKEN